MCDEKDMIEINLDETTDYNNTRLNSSMSNYFGNIRFNATTTNGFAYGQYTNIEEEKKAVVPDQKAERDGTEVISCLRQMYCPECEQRLDTSSVRYEKLFLCCLPFLPLKRLRRNAAASTAVGVKRHAPPARKLVCNRCGSSLGYWEKGN